MKRRELSAADIYCKFAAQLDADTVIWAGGYRPMGEEAEQFRALAYDFWKIGDCAQVRKIYNARREGCNAGANI